MRSPRAASRRASGCPASAISASTFGVSRTTLREALRALEAQGVLEIRTGSRGGAFVAEPSSELVAGALGNLLRFRSATARELAEFRVPVRGRERRLGRTTRRSRGAGRARAHRRRRRRACARRRRSPGRTSPRSRSSFHDAVARATGNSVRAAIMSAILDALERAFIAVPVPEGSPLRGELGPRAPRDRRRDPRRRRRGRSGSDVGARLALERARGRSP